MHVLNEDKNDTAFTPGRNKLCMGAVEKIEQEIKERYKEIPDFFDYGEPGAYDGDIEELDRARNKLEEVKDLISDDNYKKASSVFKSIDL